MNFKCLLGFHEWAGCVCHACGKRRDQGHDWSKDCEDCVTCGKLRSSAHNWNGCKCSQCGKTREEGHDWSKDCETCAVCEKTRGKAHDWSKDCEKCGSCGSSRTGTHQWKGCACTQCGKTNPQWTGCTTTATFKAHVNRIGFRDNTPEGCIIVSLARQGVIKELFTSREIARFDLETDHTWLEISKNCEIVFGACQQRKITGERSYRSGVGWVSKFEAVGSPRVFAIDVAEGRELCNLHCHDGNVTCMAVNVESRLMASGSMDAQVKLFNLRDGKEIGTLVGHEAAITSIAISQNGRLIATGGSDSTVRVWDIPSGNLKKTLVTQSEVNCVKLSLDGCFLATCVRGQVTLWEVQSGERHDLPCDCPSDFIAFGSQSQCLITGGENFLQVRDVVSHNLVHQFEFRQGKIKEIVIAADDRTAAVCTEFDTRIFDLSTGTLCDVVDGRAGFVALTPDGMTLATVCWPSDGREQPSICIWQTKSGTWQRTEQ